MSCGLGPKHVLGKFVLFYLLSSKVVPSSSANSEESDCWRKGTPAHEETRSVAAWGVLCDPWITFQRMLENDENVARELCGGPCTHTVMGKGVCESAGA